jgi:hypothetical protein
MCQSIATTESRVPMKPLTIVFVAILSAEVHCRLGSSFPVQEARGFVIRSAKCSRLGRARPNIGRW